MGKKKTFDPMKEINKTIGTTVGVGVGTGVTFQIADRVGHGASGMVASPMRMMSVVPTVQAGKTVLGSLSLLEQPKYKKKIRR